MSGILDYFPFIRIQNNGQTVSPFGRTLNFIGANSIVDQGGENAGNINIDVSGGAITAYSGAVIYRQTVLQNQVLNPALVIPFDATLYDTDNYVNLGANNTRLTIPAGVNFARITAGISVSGIAINNNGFISLRVRKNTSQSVPGIPFEFRPTTNVGGSYGITITTPFIPVVQGDFFEIDVESSFTSTPTADFQINRTLLSVEGRS